MIHENIYLETQGIKGGKTKTQKVGYAIVCFRNHQDRITIDDFYGQGETYKQREVQLIEVIDNGKVIFSGGIKELFERLKL